MAARKTRYEPRLVFGGPTVFIVVFWIAIWLMWPTNVKDNTVISPKSGMKIYYSRFGIDFGLFAPDKLLESDAELALHEDEQIDDELIMAKHKSPTRYLERQPSEKNTATELVAIVPDAKATVVGKYHPRWQQQRLFRVDDSKEKKFYVEAHSDLAEKGFLISMPDVAVLDKFNASWQITAYIEINKEGIPEHVFLVDGSGDPEVDLIVIRELYKARLTSTGEETGGRVTVNWGDS